MKLTKYFNSLYTIKQNKKIVCIVIGLYLLFLIGGLFYNNATYVSSFSSEESQDAYNEFMKDTLQQKGFIGNLWNIFSHNVLISFIGIVTGILFGLIPLYLIINTSISNSIALIVSTKQTSLPYTLIKFLPHSLFELPAIILSSSLGIIIFLSFFKQGNKKENIFKAYKDSLIIFLFILLPVILMAAIIESLVIMIF